MLNLLSSPGVEEEVQNPFTAYDSSVHSLTELVSAIVQTNTGFSLVSDSIELQYGKTYSGEASISFYDGSLEGLGIGSGLLLTSGDGTPATQNRSSGASNSFSQKIQETMWGENPGVNPDLKDTMEEVAMNLPANVSSVNDITALTFDINVTDPNLKSIRFDFVFGSEEYPNYIDSFVDTGVILVNDQNYALFNGEEDQPLSVTSENVSMGNFMHNNGPGFTSSVPAKYQDADIETVELPIEYNGVSELLSVTAPVQQGINTITIGVSDTNDTALDTGMFISSLKGFDYVLPPGVGIIPPPKSPGDDDWENPFGDFIYELPYEIENGQFVFGKSLDGSLIQGTPDNLIDAKFDFSVKDINKVDFEIDPELMTNYVDVDSEYGSQKFVYVQKMIFDDFAAAMDTWEGSETWNTFSLLNVAFGQDPTSKMFTEWLLKGEDAEDITELAGMMLDEYAPEGFTQGDLVSYLYQTLTGSSLDSEGVDGQVAFLNALGMNSNDEIFGFVAENYSNMSAIDGKFVPLDLDVLNNPPEAPEPMPEPELLFF